MAVTLIDPKKGRDYGYKGLSTDEKPDDCEVNTTFWELDSNKTFYFDGSSWNEVGT